MQSKALVGHNVPEGLMDQKTAEAPAGALEARVVRYRDLRPCYNAFIDTRSPGSEAKENFTIIGPGVSENPEQHVHIAEPHGFNIGGARQPPGCVNSQHSHDTAEVFLVHSGEWRFDLGEHGDDAQVHLSPGDVISLPTGMFRGFTATAPAEDGSPGFLWAVLGGDDPGRVLWAPAVFDMAKDYGLVLMENGSLVDTVAGQSLPDGVSPMPRTSAEQVAALHVPNAAEANALVVTATDVSGPVIGPDAPLGWPHGFTLDRHMIADARGTALSGAVVFVHRGRATLEIDGRDISLDEGDTMSIPTGVAAFLSDGSGVLFAVRRA
jgi:quercetin dioxygenase-like cupin family protein